MGWLDLVTTPLGAGVRGELVSSGSITLDPSEGTRSESPVATLVRSRAEQHGDAVWLKHGDETYSWREVLANALRAANGLVDIGVRPRDRVALMMGNRPEFIWTHLGIVFLGALSVPVNTSQRGQALRHVLEDSGAVAVVADGSLRAPVLAASEDLEELRAVVVDTPRQGRRFTRTLEELFDHPASELDLAATDPVGGVGIMYTSGTTGPPKGVVATRYDTAPLQALLDTLGIRPGETLYTTLPLFHGNALLVSMLGSMLLDARLALGQRFSASRLWDECRRYDAVEFNALGAIVNILLKQPPHADDRDHPVRVVASAGCSAEAWTTFERRFGVRIVEWFGMVDAPGCLVNDAGRVGSMGRPVAGVEFRVVDDADRPVPPGTVGELVFRHPAGRLTHYHGLPDATEDAYRGGWFHSGDLAEVDADGFFYYRGRKKQSIRRRGENISAWEIESALSAHPAVAESAAYAVASELGEDEVKVAVVLRPGASLEPAALLDHCSGRMAHYAVPRYVEFLDQLPKTETQKVRYADLRDRGLTRDTWDREAAGYRVARV
jgi:crotonobetaine/carnitine-CoA ligase